MEMGIWATPTKIQRMEIFKFSKKINILSYQAQ